MKTKTKMNAELQRHILMGAGLGLYFGMFFRPAREPNFLFALGLALLVTFVMFVVRLGRKDRPGFAVAIREVPLNFLQYSLILVALEARHFAHEAGGRLATSILMTIMGAFTGALYWWKSSSKKS